MIASRPAAGPWWPIAAAGAALTAVLMPLVMYRISPLAGPGLVIGLVGAGVVAWQPIFGVYAGILSIPLEVLGFRFGYQAITFADVVFLGTGLVATAHMILGERERLPAVHLAFAALVGVAVTGIYVAEDTSAVVRFLRVAVLLLALSVYVSRRDARDLERVLLCLAIAGAVCGLSAVLAAGPQEAQQGGAIVSGRAQSGFAQPNVLGFFLVLTLPLALVLAGRGAGVRRVALGACALAILAGLVLTLSRSSILGAATVLLVLLTWREFRRAFVALLAVLAVVGVANFQAIASNPEVSVIATRLNTLHSVGKKRDPRVAIWKTTPAIIADHPVFGVGEANFSIASRRYGLLDPSDALPYDHAHNVLLTIATELGLLGLAAFVAWLIALVRTAREALRHRGREWSLALAATASLVGLGFPSLLDYPPRTYTILAAILIVVGVLAGLRRIGDETA